MYMYDFLHQSETVLMEGNANKTVVLGINVGGRLILTNERLIFRNSLTGSVEYVNINDISFGGKDFNLLIPSKNMIKVMTKQGKIYQFLVAGKEKDSWMNAFNRIGAYTTNNESNNFSRQSEAEMQQNNDNTDNMQVEEVNFEEVKKRKSTTDGTNDIQNDSFGDVRTPTNTRKKKTTIWVVIVCILVGLGIIGKLGDHGEGSNGDNDEKADFGITLEEYIKNIETEGINNLTYVSKETVDDGMGYIYTHGDRKIFIYTRSNGNVYKVIYNDNEFEYGVQQVSSLIIKLASRFFTSTEVSESQSTIYTAIYDCLLMSGSGGTKQFDDCTIGYSRTLVEYYESAWIEAK